MDLGLRGMKAVLAGASKGIGRATAEALAGEGCDVAICARGQDGVDKAVASLKGKGVQAFGAAIDMADGPTYRAWVDRAAGQLGGCDIFISFASAGGGPASEETWKATMDLDMLATFRGIEAALPHLEKSEAGSIVAISSTAALEDFFGPQAYNAMKAAVINYASALSQALAPKGVRVNTVSPGPVFIDGRRLGHDQDPHGPPLRGHPEDHPDGPYGHGRRGRQGDRLRGLPRMPLHDGSQPRHRRRHDQARPVLRAPPCPST